MACDKFFSIFTSEQTRAVREHSCKAEGPRFKSHSAQYWKALIAHPAVNGYLTIIGEGSGSEMRGLGTTFQMSHVVRKPAFCICENKDADQLRGSAKLISAFVFATWIVQSLYFLNTKFQASSHLVWLYSLVCVGPGRIPPGPVFS